MITLDPDERITCALDTAPWGGSPEDIRVRAYDITGGGCQDASREALHGPAAVAGDLITLPAFGPLRVGRVYRLEVCFTSHGESFECSGEWQAAPP